VLTGCPHEKHVDNGHYSADGKNHCKNGNDLLRVERPERTMAARDGNGSTTIHTFQTKPERYLR
jgi:hypothetical protein